MASGPERTELDPHGHGQPSQPPDHVADVGSCRRRSGPARGHEDDPFAQQLRDQVVEHLEGRVVGPVQVVDRQQHGPLRGEAAEQTGDRLHQPRPLDVGIGTDRRRPEPLDQPAEAVEALDQAVPLERARPRGGGGPGRRRSGRRPPLDPGRARGLRAPRTPGPPPRSAGRRAPRSSPCRLRPRGRPHRHRHRGPPARAPRCSAPDRRRDRAARREGTGVLHGSRTSGVRPSRPAPQWAAAGRPPPSRPSTAPRRPPR